MRLRGTLGEKTAELDGRELLALVTADVGGSVSNQRPRQFRTKHAADIPRLLQDLVAKGLLKKDGYGRWASYRPTGPLAESRHTVEGTPDTTRGGSRHSGPSSPHNVPASQRNVASSQRNDPVLGDTELLELAATARQKTRIAPEQMREIIRNLCSGRFLTFTQIGSLVNRHPEGIRNRFLGEMMGIKEDNDKFHVQGLDAPATDRQERGTSSYRLPRSEIGDSTQIAGNSTHIDDLTHHTGESVSAQNDPALLAIAEPARLKRKFSKGQMPELIFCSMSRAISHPSLNG